MSMAGLFAWLPKALWLRALILLGLGAGILVGSVLTLVLTAVLLWQNPKTQAKLMVTILRHQARQPGQPPPVTHLSSEEISLLKTNAAGLQSPDQLYQPTNVWDVRLSFSSKQWEALGPNVVKPVLQFIKPDGSVILRNPEASRNGLAGVFGLDFPWSQTDLEFGNAVFRGAAARFKGNGTFVDSQGSYKRPFKVELSRDAAGQVAGVETLNFHNLVADPSGLSDAMAYEFFRQAGVPASRTAFARLRLSIQGRFTDRLLGLYVLVENPDAHWARRQFGVSGVALFKPVTYELFKDLGNDWEAYAGIYDPKTKLKPNQSRRLIALAKLVTHGSDAEFARQIGDYIDLEEFARFLACQVLLSNYDGLLSNGQNFLLYLDPRTEQFGFVPWDLDHCWGEFGFIGTKEQREQASLRHPWVGQNRFLERMLAVPAVYEAYRGQLARLRASLFVPERLNCRLDELAAVVRPFVAEESSRRLAQFEYRVGEARGGQGNPPDSKRRAGPGRYAFKHFVAARARAVSEQLDGRAPGVIVTRGPGR